MNDKEDEITTSEDNKEINIDSQPKERIRDKIGKYVAKGANYVVDSAKPILKDKMKEGFKKIFLKSSIKYLIIFVGIFIVILEPFKYFASHLVASLLFLSVFTWSVIGGVKVIRNYYKLPVYIMKKKSLDYGAWEFIKYKWPKIAMGITGYSIIRNFAVMFSKSYEDLPEVNNTVRDFLHYVLKDIIIFVSFFVLYFVTVQLVAKPLLLMNYAGLRTWEVYLFPFVQIKDFIVYLIHL